MDAAISIENATKRFRRSRLPWRAGPVTAVDDVTLEVAAGSIYGLVGPNGAGKTTLMRLVLGLLQPSAGSVRLLGERHSRLGSPALRHVGALIEEPRFFPYLSGRDNLVQVALLLGGGAAQTIDRALADVGLADRGGDRVGTYSLGMRQRLGLARCLLGRPSVLVLDEPTNGMDPQGIADTRDLLLRFAREHGTTVLLSSHLLEGVERLCDSVAFMDGGKIVRAGSMASLAGGGARYRIGVSDAERALHVVRDVAAAQGWSLGECAQDDGRVVVEIEGEHDVARVTRALVEAGIEVRELTSITPSLEAAYLDTIGRGHAVGWSE